VNNDKILALNDPVDYPVIANSQFEETRQFSGEQVWTYVIKMFR
jgi:hypothetical protein